MNVTNRSEILDDGSQVAVHTDFVFGKGGGNDEAMMAEFGFVGWKEEEARLAKIAEVVSILFVMERMIEGLMEWSRPLPCPDSKFGWLQQEGILLSCV